MGQEFLGPVRSQPLPPSLDTRPDRFWGSPTWGLGSVLKQENPLPTTQLLEGQTPLVMGTSGGAGPGLAFSDGAVWSVVGMTHVVCPRISSASNARDTSNQNIREVGWSFPACLHSCIHAFLGIEGFFRATDWPLAPKPPHLKPQGGQKPADQLVLRVLGKYFGQNLFLKMADAPPPPGRAGSGQ